MYCIVTRDIIQHLDDNRRTVLVFSAVVPQFDLLNKHFHQLNRRQ